MSMDKIKSATAEDQTQDGERADDTPAVVEFETEHRRAASTARKRNQVIAAIIAIVALSAFFLLWSRGTSTQTNNAVNADAGKQHTDEEGREVRMKPEALAFANFEYEGVTERQAVALLRVTGTIEPNPRGVQQVTPLVGGRIEQVSVAIGDRVGVGQIIATLSSPQIAEMHGKLHEAETTLALAERNLARVERSENRVAVLSAKARLDETEATLRRTRRLVELGAGAGKDLISAEAAYRTAKAEYDFQSNISLNRELQEARAAVETARVDLSHIRDQMLSLGASVQAGADHDHKRDSSLINLRAPAPGIITERAINPGAGVEANRPLFTISNLSSLYVIANVPEAQMKSVKVGTPAEVRSAALDADKIRGRVSYIDSQLDEATRTARVRVEIANPGERLRTGMFVEVGFQTASGGEGSKQLMIPSSAIQRDGNQTIVFLPKEDEPGAFEIREIEIGGEADGYTRVLSGLAIGERVVTKGSFTLKTQMQKGEIGDHDH